GMSYRKGPRDSTAPIVTDQDELIVTELRCKRTDVFNLILLHVSGLGGQVVAAHIRNHDLIVAAELSQLVLPRIPKLWKAMQKHEQFSLASRHVMQVDAVHSCIP